MLRFTAALIVLAAIGAHANKAILNADQVLEIDGRKIFVICFSLPPPVDGKAPNGKNAFAELADVGATFLRAGPLGEGWNAARFEQEKKYQDAAARYGMHCWLSLREAASIKPGVTNHEQLLRKILTTFRDHPGLGAYKGVDEPEWGKHPLPPMERAWQILKELDPNHPLVLIQAPRGTVASLKAYNGVSDIIGADIYPIAYPPGLHSQFVKTNAEISMVGDYARLMMEVGEGEKSLWMTLQVVWSGVCNPGKTLRLPTFPEERFMTYQAIIAGARGINYFGASIPAGWNEEDQKLGWNWHFWNRVLRPVIEEIGTKSLLYPALVAPESKLPVKVKGAGVEFCVRETDKDIFVLACKREGATLHAEFSGLPTNATGGEVLFESPRTVEIKDGKFSDWFAPFDMHVYRFRR
jgi:hypothetical protein